MSDHQHEHEEDPMLAETARFLTRVSSYDGGMYGGAVGDLTAEERDLAVRLWEQIDPAQRDQPGAATYAARTVLRRRGLMPEEPDPRKTYDPFHGARHLPRHDGFGRSRRRRRGRRD